MLADALQAELLALVLVVNENRPTDLPADVAVQRQLLHAATTLIDCGCTHPMVRAIAQRCRHCHGARRPGRQCGGCTT